MGVSTLANYTSTVHLPVYLKVHYARFSVPFESLYYNLVCFFSLCKVLRREARLGWCSWQDYPIIVYPVHLHSTMKKVEAYSCIVKLMKFPPLNLSIRLVAIQIPTLVNSLCKLWLDADLKVATIVSVVHLNKERSRQRKTVYFLRNFLFIGTRMTVGLVLKEASFYPQNG